LIFVTVGSQLRFDRLVRTVDEWAARTGRSDVFAQIGQTGFRPRAIRWTEKLGREEFLRTMEDATCIVSHAGTGTIITALELGKPLLVLPRRASLGETRNEHQTATARSFAKAGYLHVAYDERELEAALARIDTLAGPPRITPAADPHLIETVRSFVHADTAQLGPHDPRHQLRGAPWRPRKSCS